MAKVAQETTGVYEGIIRKVFSGRAAPGTRLAERDLAQELGVSRIPVRESLAKLVAQGMLLGGKKGQGVWMREYSPEEIRQLYGFRAALESGSAREASVSATESDLTHMEMICEQMEAVGTDTDNYDWARGAELDRKFHETLAKASHNERFVQAIKALLTECYYVFYVLWDQRILQAKCSKEEAAERLRRSIGAHRELLELIRQGKADEAEQKVRTFMRESSDWITRDMIADDLNKT